MALRSHRTSAETPAHRANAGPKGATALTLTVTKQGERFEVGRDGAAAIITNELPHAGPRITIAVQPGDAIEYMASDPLDGIRYQIPSSNGARVTFTVGTKTLRADPGTEVIFRPDGTIEVIWPDGPEELFRFVFAADTLLPAVRVPYLGLPDLLPPPNVSPSTP